MWILPPFRFVTVPAMALVFSICAQCTKCSRHGTQTGNACGDGYRCERRPRPQRDGCSGEAPKGGDRPTLVTRENGFFQFSDVKRGTPYQINISAKGFADWTSPAITLDPGQFKIVTGIQLRIETDRTTVDVHYDPRHVAAEQLKAEEKQRIFGIIPNFYVSYESDPAPLTAKMKFKLALKVSVDPVTAEGVFLVASAKQAGNSPQLGQGWGAFGERAGVTAVDGFSDIMIGGAILPSLLHQDPRYFYQGTGTTSSYGDSRHAMFSPFVAKGDNGKWRPKHSSVGGDLASSALADLYYPTSNGDSGLLSWKFCYPDLLERIGASLAQEFLFGKFTRRSGHMK